MKDKIIYGKEYELPYYRQRSNSGEDQTYSKLIVSGILIVLLVIGLCISSFALAITANEYITGNSFATGKFRINILKKTEPTVYEIAPGQSFTITYTLENESATDIYYKVYTEDIPDGLADVLSVAVYEQTETGANKLYQGVLKNFIYENPELTSGTVMKAGATRDITVTYSMAADAGNDYMGTELSQNLTVKAVQAKNNPFKIFD